MLTFSNALVKSGVAIALASCAIVAYSDLVTSQPVHPAVTKVENISLDYARAHMELMKLPDAEPVSSF